VRQSLLTVGLLVLVAVAWMLRDLVMLIGFAALLAYALDPMVTWLERRPLPGRRSLPRGVASALVIVLLMLTAGAALAQAVPRLAQQLAAFARAAPGALAQLEDNVRAFLESRGLGTLPSTADGGSSDTVASLLAAAERGLVSLLGRVLGNLGGLATVILLPLFTFYILAVRDRARSSLLELIPDDQHPNTVRFLDAVERALRSYVRGQAIVCLAMGAAVGFLLRLFGFPAALLLGVLVGVAEIIPILGFWIAASAIALEGYSKSPGLALAGVVAYIAVNTLMQTFITPRLLGRAVKLHPFVVNVSVIGGGMLLGASGAILALPAVAAAKALLDEFAPRRYRSGAGASGVTTTLS
jgi:predicted PurR-regulated permease PerM